eukprot:scaffold6550_cov131-Isochrysis_galbana.AAC.10
MARRSKLESVPKPAAAFLSTRLWKRSFSAVSSKHECALAVVALCSVHYTSGSLLIAPTGSRLVIAIASFTPLGGG